MQHAVLECGIGHHQRFGRLICLDVEGDSLVIAVSNERRQRKVSYPRFVDSHLKQQAARDPQARGVRPFGRATYLAIGKDVALVTSAHVLDSQPGRQIDVVGVLGDERTLAIVVLLGDQQMLATGLGVERGRRRVVHLQCPRLGAMIPEVGADIDEPHRPGVVQVGRDCWCRLHMPDEGSWAYRGRNNIALEHIVAVPLKVPRADHTTDHLPQRSARGHLERHGSRGSPVHAEHALRPGGRWGEGGLVTRARQRLPGQPIDKLRRLGIDEVEERPLRSGVGRVQVKNMMALAGEYVPGIPACW